MNKENKIFALLFIIFIMVIGIGYSLGYVEYVSFTNRFENAFADENGSYDEYIKANIIVVYFMTFVYAFGYTIKKYIKER